MPTPPPAEQAARDAATLGSAQPANEYGPPPPSVIAPPRQTPAEARLQMMQHEDEEGEGAGLLVGEGGVAAREGRG